MAQSSNNLKLPWPTEGVIRSAQLNDTVAPENSDDLAVNMHYDRIGARTTRNGIETYATQLSGKILSLGSLFINSSTTKYLLQQVGNLIYSWNGSTQTLVRTMTSTTSKARYAQFLNLVYTVNGNPTVSGSDDPATFDGTSYGTTQCVGFPKGDYIQGGFEGRVWILDANLDRVYYSDIVDTSGNLTYSGNYVEKISPQDGESFTGIHRHPRALLLFKQNHIFRVYGASSFDPYPAYNVGTFSNESIVEAKDGLYFHHPSGFYKFNYDGQPTEISRRIKDFVRAIPVSAAPDVTGTWDGIDNIIWSIGSVTVEGVTYTNCMVRYTISTQVWTIYNKEGDATISSMITFNNGNVIAPLCGLSDGQVCQLEKGETDLGLPIVYEAVTRWISFLAEWTKIKNISGFGAYAENAGGASLQYQTDKEGPNEWRDVLEFGSNYVTLAPNADTDDFSRIRFRIKGQTSGTPIIFSGIEILTLKDQGFAQN